MSAGAILASFEADPVLPDTRASLVRDVESGLARRPRSLSPWMFYDAYGSALFERITTLAEYYPSRLEREILGRVAEEIVARVQLRPPGILRVFELGAGTAAKTEILLEAALGRYQQLTYEPCDISPAALYLACASIESSLPAVKLRPVVGDYVRDSPQLGDCQGATLAICIGSSIGNFSASTARTILRNLSSQMKRGDALLLGTDMVKDEKVLLAAYDDREGITAEFNLNILRRINRELGSDFDLSGFRHCARWNRAESRIEMHLESLREQCARIPPARLLVHFAEGETIHTESSYKFTPDTLGALLHDAGFKVEQMWTDPLQWYALTLAGPR
jgi:L-histidine N-alpha-methyltransferase